MFYDEEILLEHFEIPEDFSLEINVFYKRGSINVICVDKETGAGSCIHTNVDEYGSKVGTIIDAIIDSIKGTIEIR